MLGYVTYPNNTFVNASYINEGDDIMYEYGTSYFDKLPEGAEVIDLAGKTVVPAFADIHVHFREPGLTEKGDIVSESRAAAAGGVTTYFDMPNCQPTTTTPREWVKKTATAENKSRVNFA